MSSAHKKTFRSTWLMMLLVAALAGYTAWEYRQAAKNEGVDVDKERKLFDLRSENVTEIHLKQKEGGLSLKKVGDQWQMLEPIADEGDNSAVEAFLYSAVIQKGKIFRGDEDGKNPKWADFGLEPAGSVLELKTAKGTQTLDVSSKNAYDGSFYLRQNGELLLGDRGLAQLVGRSPNSFRQRRLWRDPDVTVDSAEVDVNSDQIRDKFQITRAGDKWTLQPKPDFAVDEERLANWLIAVEQLTPSEIVADTMTDQAKRDALLVKPSMRVKLHFKKKDGSPGEWTMTIGQDKAEDVFLYSNLRSTIYKTAKSTLAKIRVPSRYFRNGKLPFHFDVEQAGEVQAFSGGKAYTFKKEGAGWKTTSGEGELDTDRLVALMQKIHELEALEFLPMREARGFKPSQEIVVRDGKGEVLLDLGWGDGFKSSKPYNKGMTFRYVKTNLEKEAMGVNGVSIDALTSAPLVKTKAAAPAAKQKR